MTLGDIYPFITAAHIRNIYEVALTSFFSFVFSKLLDMSVWIIAWFRGRRKRIWTYKGWKRGAIEKKPIRIYPANKKTKPSLDLRPPPSQVRGDLQHPLTIPQSDRIWYSIPNMLRSVSRSNLINNASSSSGSLPSTLHFIWSLSLCQRTDVIEKARVLFILSTISFSLSLCACPRHFSCMTVNRRNKNSSHIIASLLFQGFPIHRRQVQATRSRGKQYTITTTVV